MTRRIIAAVLCIGVLVGAVATADAATRNYLPGTYKGQTAQKAKLSLKVVKSKKAVMSFNWQGAVMDCSDGQTRQLNGFKSPSNVRFKLSSKGKFEFDVPANDGAVQFATVGTIKKKKASGALQLQARFNDAEEIDVDGTINCDSGIVPWTAKHK